MLLLLLPGSGFCSAVAAADKQVSFDYAAEIEPLLEDYCFRCHGADKPKGDLDLEAAVEVRPLVRRREMWRTALSRLENEYMPPKTADQPTDAQRRTLIAWLDQSINHFDYSGIDDPGYEPMRRLTHREYQNTLRDLFGMPIAGAEDFPADLSGISGFDNSANTLFLQPILMERYFSAADHALRQALPADAQTLEQKRAKALVFIARPSETASDGQAARQVLDRFMQRAYRRPVAEDEVDRVLTLYTRGRRDGVGFEDAVKRALHAVLVSPKFLMKAESTKPTAKAYAIDEWGLASRLSYFLWASMPDDALFALARQKKLRDPAVLAQQVQRMLADPKADTLGSVFAAQWLGFQILGTRVRLDPIDNPWCTDTLMAAMRDEAAMLFTSLVRDNQPIARLIDARYTFLNHELAEHYRITGIEGTTMRRVTLTDETRGGIFGLGSVQAITSFPGRTSPVVRGNWILSSVLGTPPPKPPPDAGEFSPKIRRNRKLSAREKLALHSENPTCAGCHAQIDPLGFGLENYDWFGRWRTERRGKKVDARGRMPDGTEFEGLAGLRTVILEQRHDDLVRQVTHKLLSYALGRQLEYYDEPAVRKIVQRAEKDDYRLQTVIQGIVESYPFQYKKNRPQPKDGNSS